MTRIEQLRKLANDHACENFLVTYLPHIRWATGFTGDYGVLLVGPGKAWLYTHAFFVEALKKTSDVEGIVLSERLSSYLSKQNVPEGRVLAQADHLTISQQRAFEEALATTEFRYEANLADGLVAVKSKEEIEGLTHAARQTDAVFERVVNQIKPGVTERELATEITHQLHLAGASSMPYMQDPFDVFNPLVAVGSHAAEAHAAPSDRKVKKGELLLMDFGGLFNGYCSDMSRTVAVGEPPDELRTAYDVVLTALANSLDAARSGMAASGLDSVARDYLAKKGFKENFITALGHGLGLEVHESPRIGPFSDEPLPENSVVAIEPGVYVPGKFGIRIEDTIVLGRSGCKNLTSSPKELLVL